MRPLRSKTIDLEKARALAFTGRLGEALDYANVLSHGVRLKGDYTLTGTEFSDMKGPGRWLYALTKGREVIAVFDSLGRLEDSPGPEWLPYGLGSWVLECMSDDGAVVALALAIEHIEDEVKHVSE